jgi:hypothetical protein
MPTGQRPNPPQHSMHFAVAGTYQGDTPFANTLWVRNGNAQTPSQADFNATVASVGTKFVEHFGPQVNTGVVWTNCDGYYYGVNGIDLAYQAPITGSGGKAGIHMPASVALCVGWRVQQHYKGGHPRTYLVGPAADQLLGGRLFTSSYVTAVAGAANAFNTDVNAMSLGAIGLVKLGVVSFVLRNEWRAPPVFRDFTVGGAHCDTRVDSQRRRLGRDVPP